MDQPVCRCGGKRLVSWRRQVCNGERPVPRDGGGYVRAPWDGYPRDAGNRAVESGTREPAAASAMTFADVDPDAYYAAAVRWAASAGVAEGHSAAAFAPEEPVTREQAAAILERYAALRGAQPGNAGSLAPFADADCISPWARESAAWAVGAGILCGNGGGMLDPLGCLTRAEAAAMLQRLLEM